MTRAVGTWGPAILWAALLIFLSSRSDLPLSLHGGRDKAAHFGAYAVLGLLLARAHRGSGLSLAWAVLAGWAFGAVDELFQGLVPGRTPALSDWVADALGVLAGVGVFRAWERLRDRAASAHQPEP